MIIIDTSGLANKIVLLTVKFRTARYLNIPVNNNYNELSSFEKERLFCFCYIFHTL